MITPQYEEAYKRLNSAQKDAVDTIEGPVMVIAGPGTGKTQILTLRIANILLKTDTNPSSILVLTFSESAALQVRNRLASMIGSPAYRVDISTFHGFCNEVIRNNLEEFPHLVSSESMTDVEQIEIVEKIILDNSFQYLKPIGEPLHYLRNAISGINDLKKENISPEKFLEVLNIQHSDFEQIEDLYHEKGKYKGEMKGKYKDLQKEIAKNKELQFIYAEYQKQLVEQKLYDFNDMLLEVVRALENNGDLRLRLQEKYQYILVDEHQDTNSAQNKIVELLCDFYEIPNLFVVGDEKQAIYRFQGASLENFLYFRTLYPAAKMISLKENYRSHQTILDAASSMISHNVTANLLPEKITLQAMGGIKADSIKVAQFSDYHAEYQYIAESIKSKVESQKGKIAYSDFAVLVRNNRDLEPLIESFERNSIPFSINTDSNVFADPEIQKFLLILRAIDKFPSGVEMVKAMHVSYFNLEPIDVYKISSYAMKNRIMLGDVLEDLNSEKAKELGLRKWENLISFYQLIKAWYKLSHNATFEQLFVAVLKQSGMLESIHKHPKYFEIQDKVIGLFEEAKMLFQRRKQLVLSQFLEYLDLLNKHNLALKAEVRTERSESVKLMTAHRSKGLEFEYVYIPQVFEGHWGNAKARSRGFKLPWEYLANRLDLKDIADENEDERRLFFVALTRAKKDILLSYSVKSLEGKEQLPAQFLQEIEQSLLEEKNILEFEQNFQNNKDSLFNIEEIIHSGEKDVEFVRNLFKERGLSVTGFDNFLSCPWKFFYRNLLSLPDTKSFPMIFGTAIHFALDQYVKSLKDKPLEVADVKKYFKTALEKEALTEIDRKALLSKGNAIIEKFIPSVASFWHDKYESEVTVRGVQFSDTITLNGRIDMIEPKSSNEVIVHDFKTGKPKSRNSINGSNPASDRNYLRQLVFYKILLDHHQDGRRRMIGGTIDYIEPSESGNFKSEHFEITDEMVKDLEQQIIVVGKQIWDVTFWDERCIDPECEYCKMRNLMN